MVASVCGRLSGGWFVCLRVAAPTHAAIFLSTPSQICAALLRLKPTVVRGNPSEILALAGASHTTKGVDSTAAATGKCLMME